MDSHVMERKGSRFSQNERNVMDSHMTIRMTSYRFSRNEKKRLWILIKQQQKTGYGFSRENLRTLT